MKLLVVHQNFPGQYLHLMRALVAEPGHQVVFLTQRQNVQVAGLNILRYAPQGSAAAGTHPYLLDLEQDIRNGQAVARAALELRASGFVPDLMLGHVGWGETWFLKDVYPDVPLLGLFEYFHPLDGLDGDEQPLTIDHRAQLRMRNAAVLVGLDVADAGHCATRWQRDLHPPPYRERLQVIHEGIDTDLIAPDPSARLRIGDQEFAAGEETITFVARNLEPMRGFPLLLRALPAVLAARPKARVIVVGGQGNSYSVARADGRSHFDAALDEAGAFDRSRVHFIGTVSHVELQRIYQVSRVHTYLSRPFVVSWSLLEAMAAGALVVAMRTAPVEEVIVDGENGLLVDARSPAQLTARLIDALADPQAFAAQRAAGRRTIVERYDLNCVCLPAFRRLMAQQLRR